MAGTSKRRGPQPRSGASPGQVQSLTRALAILKALAESAEGMGLTDLAQMLGLAPSTAHRLLTTLEAERFVRLDPATMCWGVGVGAFTVGNAFARTRDIVALGRPHMRRLMEASGETVNLYVMVDGEAVCMGQVECRQTVRAIARPGGRVKMHCSGAGKAMMAWLDEAEVTRILQAHGLPRSTERTLDTPKRLRADLAAIRERGYALDDEEFAPGMRCVAAAVRDASGEPLGAVSLSGPLIRVTDEALPGLGRLVADTARALAGELGGPLPTEKAPATP